MSETKTTSEVTAQAASELTFRGYQLKREGNIVYLGDLNKQYFAMLQVLSSNTLKAKKVKGEETPEDLQAAAMVLIKLMNVDPNIKISERVEKKAEKEGIYQALDLAATWLDRYAKE